MMNSTRTEVQISIAEIAPKISFTPVSIPPELQDMPVMDAIYLRLQSHVQALGGYDALAKACPPGRAKIWQKKIERTGRYKLGATEFCRMVKLFKDPVLVALLAKDHLLFDLNDVPQSEYSLADLVWTLKRYSALGMLLTCDWREALLDGHDCEPLKIQLFQLLRETAVLLHQIQLETAARRDVRNTPDLE